MKKSFILILSLSIFAFMFANINVFADDPCTLVKVELDGLIVHPATYGDKPEYASIKNGRTMVPVRFLAEALGANVTWYPNTRTVSIIRADKLIEMFIGKDTAKINGIDYKMDAIPYIENSRTYIPARYISEFFGQKVDWDSLTYTVSIKEDKVKADSSNLEAWALPMGAIKNFENSFFLTNENGHLFPALMVNAPLNFGGAKRYANKESGYDVKLKSIEGDTYVSVCRWLLSDGGWGINSRKGVNRTIVGLYESNSRKRFENYLEKAKTMSDKERAAAILKIKERFGDRGFLCWDAFRISNIAQWAYVSGYITYEEALNYIAPAATTVKNNFSSWDKATENYLYGYYFWKRDYEALNNIKETTRWKLYDSINKEGRYKAIFDESLFKAGVVPMSE